MGRLHPNVEMMTDNSGNLTKKRTSLSLDIGRRI